MIKEIPKSDIIVRPLKVYKQWRKDHIDIPPIFGENPGSVLIDVDSDSKSHNLIKKVIYSSIESQFYKNSDTASVLYEVGNRRSYASKDERVLEDNIAVISIPQDCFGEGIKVGSLVLQDYNGDVYTDDGYSNLIDSGSNIHGNVFYDRGLVVLTRNIVSGSTLSSYVLDYRSTKTLYENEIFISVLENEFNFSQNPTAVYEDGGSKKEQIIQRPGSRKINDLVTSSFYDPGIKWVRGKKYSYYSNISGFTSGSVNEVKGSFDDYEISGSVDPTGSYLAPFITTIALYDDELNMVAAAKLPKPIKSLPDYPLNFIIRFDT